MTVVSVSRRRTLDVLLSVFPQPATLQTVSPGISSLLSGMEIQLTVLLFFTASGSKRKCRAFEGATRYLTFSSSLKSTHLLFSAPWHSSHCFCWLLCGRTWVTQVGVNSNIYCNSMLAILYIYFLSIKYCVFIINLASLFLLASINVGIINGTEAKPHSRPYLVSVQIEGMHNCGGFLVSDLFVMTAGHCWKNGQVMTVVIGAHNLMDDSVDRIPVKFYHIYPGYTYLFNDIMLLQLEKPVQRGTVVDWISIPKTNDDIEANTICSIAGWGRTSSDGSQSDHLMEANVRIIDSRKCKEDWGHYYSSVNMMCAGSGHGFCRGDSGGPLVCNNVAVGIVSFFEAGNCDKPIVPNVYTKISQFLPWIKEVINSV
uniref:Peptidase S1 domain-containing protein n=1 Tax=Astyanax mexicanus TaxID=7994 RepID=A0A8B9K561_ASTMX